MTTHSRQFASDNCSGICPEAWEALAEANHGHAPSYGDDEWTERACDLVRQVFETDCEIFFVFNGTAANALALATLCQPFHSVLCHNHAHVEVDECGAPEFFSHGSKVLLVGGDDGRIDPVALEQTATKRSDIHYPKPRALSLTEATELGTVYRPAHLQALKETASRLGLRIHMDGARFANAVVSTGASLKELSWQAGVDVLCLGGSKNGLGVGEMVVFFNKPLAAEFDYRCKQAGQLCSKMRFMAAPWVGLLRDGAWLRNATNANRTAQRLEEKLRDVPGLDIAFPREANSVFVRMPPGKADAVRARGWRFYEMHSIACSRLMCSWDTTDEDVDQLAADIRRVMAGNR